MRIGVLGNDDFVTGFKLAGVDREYLTNGEVTPVFEQALKDDEVGILIIHERDFDRLPVRLIKAVEKLHRPVVITISEGGGKSNLREMIKRCVGIDLWK